MDWGSGLAFSLNADYFPCMSRPLRIEFPGAAYHVTSRGDRREAIYLDDADRSAQLAIIEQAMEAQSPGSGLAFPLHPAYFLHMSRPLRIEFPGAVYHVTSRGDRHEAIYRDDADKVEGQVSHLS